MGMMGLGMIEIDKRRFEAFVKGAILGPESMCQKNTTRKGKHVRSNYSDHKLG